MVAVADGTGVKVEVGTTVSVGGTDVTAVIHEGKVKATSKTVMTVFVFICTLIIKGTAQRLALVASAGFSG
jgi:hypothetical protein